MFNLPNTLTAIRIILIPFFINFLVYGYTDYALVCYVVAGLSDAADGIAARMLNQRTALGAILDPLADKMLALAAFTALTVLGVIPLWLTLSVIFRDVVIVSGTIALHITGHRDRPGPTMLGKLTTAVQFMLITTALVCLYLGRDIFVVDWLMMLTLGVVAASGLQYVLMGLDIASGPTEGPGKQE